MNLPKFLNNNNLSFLKDVVTDNLNYINLEISNLPPKEQLRKLYSNLFYSWDLEHELPTKEIFTSWTRNPSPTKTIDSMNSAEFAAYWEKNKQDIASHLRNLFLYLNNFTYSNKRAINDVHIQTLFERPIAYFSLEFGLVEWLHIYSGGLGILAGDMLKQASDMGLPMIGVTLYYRHGFFNQKIDNNNQTEDYSEFNPDDYPFELVRNAKGDIAEVEVLIQDHPVFVRAWKVKVGRRDLLMLDTNYEKNTREEDRLITGHLYGGDEDTRIRQEIVLGVGGYRMLLELGHVPIINHMNEGHSAFLILAIAERIMNKNEISFNEALPKVKKGLVFTNHTLKTAGNDTFQFELMQKYFQIYAVKLGITFEEIFKLGMIEGGKFSMTIAGLQNAGISNAVSILHSKAAKSIWPTYDLIPVTNGVHMPTWVGRELHLLLDKYVDEKWYDPVEPTDYSRIHSIPNQMLWSAHQNQKKNLLDMLNKSLGTDLKVNVPTLSWFRRFTAYKRPDTIISDVNRLKEIVSNQNQPVQILVGGKAHPKDTGGKEIIKRFNEILSDPIFKDKVVFVPGYNWALARHLVAGSDVWINTPKRNEEASGTSGMKASANGVLQFTTLDGWTDEVDWTGKGWILEEDKMHEFYSIIADQILPTYYNKTEEGISDQWIEMMKKTIETVIYNYSSERQLEDYIKKLYLPVLRNYH